MEKNRAFFWQNVALWTGIDQPPPTMHPALIIFLVSLVNHLITWVGRDTLQEIVRMSQLTAVPHCICPHRALLRVVQAFFDEKGSFRNAAANEHDKCTGRVFQMGQAAPQSR